MRIRASHAHTTALVRWRPQEIRSIQGANETHRLFSSLFRRTNHRGHMNVHRRLFPSHARHHRVTVFLTVYMSIATRSSMYGMALRSDSI